MAAQPEKLKFFSVGTEAKGIFAIGVAAEGIVAIGVNAIGVVAVGVNAMGTLLAVGVNAVGLVGLSVANSLALVALSVVNVIGGFGVGVVNELLHPALSPLVLVAMVVLSLRVKGEWRRPTLPPLVEVSALQRGTPRRGWAEATLLATDATEVVVGDSDGEQGLAAELKVRQHAQELLAAGTTKVLVDVEVAEEMTSIPHADYRAAAPRTLLLRALELRPWPRRPAWPQNPKELRWVIAKSLWLAAALGSVASIGMILL